jgi:hypothetical protein
VADEQPGDELIRAFARWAAGERAQSAAEDRARRRWLGEQATATANLQGLLVDLAEQAAPVVLWLPDHRCAGRLIGVGRDFCVVSQTNGRPVVVPLKWLSAVSPERATPLPAGDRSPALELSLVGAFAAMAEERLPVSIKVGSKAVEGEVHSVGEDVVTLRGHPPARQMVHVPVGAVMSCELR